MSAAGLRAHSFRRSDGELRCVVERANGEAIELWVRTSLAEPPATDTIVLLMLIPAISVGGRLEIDAPVDETMVARIPEIEAVLRAFQLGGDWTPATSLRHKVELVCPVEAAPPRRADRGVATYFSGGVDSFSTLRRNRDIDHLIYIAGMDAPVGERYDDHHEHARGIASVTAERLELPLLTVETNARELYERFDLVGPTFGGGILGASARAVAPAIGRLYIASSQAYRWLLENSSHPMLDPLWGRGALEVIHDGAELSRTEKLESLVADPLAQAALRVCWEGTGTGVNCCRCEKCLRTMVALESLGALERFPTFNEPLDLEAVAAARPSVRHELAYWVENLELAVGRGAAQELIGAIEAAIANAGPGGPPTPRRSRLLNPKQHDGRSLYLDPDARAALEGSRAVVFLVGGYDGSGAADLLSLRAALGCLASLDEGVSVLSVIPLEGLPAHRSRIAAATDLAPCPLAFDPRGAGGETTAAELGLIPASLPAGIEAAVSYLYGGDYLNRHDADRILGTLEALDGLARAVGVTSRPLASSGLAIEPDWARGAGVRWRSVLGRLDRLRVRDPVSLAAAVHLADREGKPSAVLSGDDAVGLLTAADIAGDRRPEAGTGELRINVERDPPEECSPAGTFAAALIAEIDARTTDRVTIHPLAVDPARPESQAAVLSRGDLTVATPGLLTLASLLLGVCPVILCASESDTRNAQGLRRDFELPDALVPSVDDDPKSTAAALVALWSDEAAVSDLRRKLELGRERVRNRRRTTEAELLTSISLLASGVEKAGAGERTTDPDSQDYRRLLGAYLRLAERLEKADRLAADRGAALDGVRRSTSWRLTTPLRSARALLRR